MGRFDESCETTICIDCPFNKAFFLCQEAYDNFSASFNEILSNVKKEIEQIEEKRK